MKVWEGVSEFVAVAETESFTAAAKKLGISIAQVSRQVNVIEERLKVKLFYRTTRKVSLTESGAVYYQYCRDILDNLADAEKIVSNFHSHPQGNIRLTAPVTYGEEVIAPIVNDFLVKYPQVRVTLDLNNQRVDLLTEGYDLAIRPGYLPDSGLIARKLTTRQFYVCATAKYLKQYGMPTSIKTLQEHNCLVGVSDYWRFLNRGKVEQLQVTGSLRCNSGHSLVKAALKHIGIVQLPDHYVQKYLDSKKLVEVLAKYKQAKENIWLVYPHKSYLPFKIKTLIDFLFQRLAQ
ncbi:LysR family transcriptional regulator [Agarilytica rhodophyticola]|uniref:LysR family transcriptional regulator n=1 Tax=Agarilytica rhodophyticola TaxID=1737490 RepID=UPI000B349579|nr:LysR family transcriptional regulator [Agarilytica rhodophyticola]